MTDTQVPQRSRPFDLANTTMVPREIAPGVFALLPKGAENDDHTATTGGFVVGDDCVLAIESLSTGRLASEAIAGIRAQTALPIRYLVNTSFHSDHCFGNFVFPAETVVITHRNAKPIIEGDFDQEVDNMEAFMGYRPGRQEVLPRRVGLTLTDEIGLDLGGVAVRVRAIGWIQTQGDLAVEVPSANVVFTGNALPGPPPAFQWLGDGQMDETIAATRRYCDSLDDDTIIVGGHGRPMHRGDIEYSLTYLRELQQLVGEAVADGCDLAAVLERVRMERYSNYSAYELAHFRVNVPAAYRAARSV